MVKGEEVSLPTYLATKYCGHVTREVFLWSNTPIPIYCTNITSFLEDLSLE